MDLINILFTMEKYRGGEQIWEEGGDAQLRTLPHLPPKSGPDGLFSDLQVYGILLHHIK